MRGDRSPLTAQQTQHVDPMLAQYVRPPSTTLAHRADVFCFLGEPIFSTARLGLSSLAVGKIGGPENKVHSPSILNEFLL